MRGGGEGGIRFRVRLGVRVRGKVKVRVRIRITYQAICSSPIQPISHSSPRVRVGVSVRVRVGVNQSLNTHFLPLLQRPMKNQGLTKKQMWLG